MPGNSSCIECQCSRKTGELSSSFLSPLHKKKRATPKLEGLGGEASASNAPAGLRARVPRPVSAGSRGQPASQPAEEPRAGRWHQAASVPGAARPGRLPPLRHRPGVARGGCPVSAGFSPQPYVGMAQTTATREILPLPRARPVLAGQTKQPPRNWTRGMRGASLNAGRSGFWSLSTQRRFETLGMAERALGLAAARQKLQPREGWLVALGEWVPR